MLTRLGSKMSVDVREHLNIIELSTGIDILTGHKSVNNTIGSIINNRLHYEHFRRPFTVTNSFGIETELKCDVSKFLTRLGKILDSSILKVVYLSYNYTHNGEPIECVAIIDKNLESILGSVDNVESYINSYFDSYCEINFY